MSWSAFWAGLLVTSATGFAVMVLVTSVRGWFDLKVLLSSSRARSRPENPGGPDPHAASHEGSALRDREPPDHRRQSGDY